MNFLNSTDHANRIPISIITGFLGSGKTTLLNQLTRQLGMNSIALIINEFGEIGIDNLLVETAIENTLLLENGCICCSVRGDLIDTVNDLFAKVRNGVIPGFSRIVIETTGLAEPGSIVNTLTNERVMASRCRLDNVVSLIDGVQGKIQAQRYPEAMKQIAQADIGLITKRDLISAADVADLETFVTEINPALRLLEIERGQVSPDMLFDHSNKYSGISPSPLYGTVWATAMMTIPLANFMTTLMIILGNTTMVMSQPGLLWTALRWIWAGCLYGSKCFTLFGLRTCYG